MEINMNGVGERIRAIREQRHLTLEQLAKIVGRDKQTVWRWEHATRGISLKTVNMLCEKLDCHPSYLLGYNDDIDAPFAPQTACNSAEARPRAFGQILREERKNKKISVEELANRLAVPPARVTELENMINAPPEREVVQIARGLDVPEEFLLKETALWSHGDVPQKAVMELARRMLEIDPYLNRYLDNVKPTDAEARFLAAAIRLGFERHDGK